MVVTWRARVLTHVVLWGLLISASAVQANEALRQQLEAVQSGQAVTSAGEPLLARQALSQFYLARDYEWAWSDGGMRNDLLDAISQADRDGLLPSDYHHDVLQALMSRPLDELTPAERTDLDLLLSDGFLMLGSHLVEGKVNPETIDPEWLANRRQRDLARVLENALVVGDIPAALDTLRPRQAGYRQLMDARAGMVGLVGRDWPAIPAGASIRPDSDDERLPLIRQRLVELGDLAPDEQLTEPADHYDDSLSYAVSRFQRRHGLDDDGIIGRDTLAALNVTPETRLQQIDLNLERWRWLPDSLGDSYILVNIAAFELQWVEDYSVRLTKRVIVGRPFRRTPVFSDRIRYLVFNPTWTVPSKLIVQDKLPEIIRDPAYLERLGFTVYRGWGADRQPVDAQTVDWRSLAASRNVPYQLVQAPGPQNALGQVKFMFPNKFDVYLHDTPSRDLFARNERSFSSGCIRVHEPLDLAAALLEKQAGWNRERIDSVIASRQTTTVTLKEPIPVHLEYWTAWVGVDGRLAFRNDVYDRDPRLLAALRRSVSDTEVARAD